MNISREDRFHELAHKALAKNAQPSEQAELRGLIAESPKLKEEFEQMGAESAVAREILPLLENVQHPHGRIPPPPMQRLQKAVREVFEPHPESQAELGELLRRLDKWAARRLGVERERVMELISFIRESSEAAGREPVLAEMAMLHKLSPIYAAAPQLKEEDEVRPVGEMEEDRKRKGEFEERLRSLESRICQAEQVMHECKSEMLGLLEAFTRNQEARAERKRAHPGQSSQPLE